MSRNWYVTDFNENILKIDLSRRHAKALAKTMQGIEPDKAWEALENDELSSACKYQGNEEVKPVDTRFANQFVVDVVNEGGCVISEIGDSYKTLEDSLEAAKAIAKEDCRQAGAFNLSGQAGVNVTITACDEYTEIASDGCVGGIVIWDQFV